MTFVMPWHNATNVTALDKTDACQTQMLVEIRFLLKSDACQNQMQNFPAATGKLHMGMAALQ